MYLHFLSGQAQEHPKRNLPACFLNLYLVGILVSLTNKDIQVNALNCYECYILI